MSRTAADPPGRRLSLTCRPVPPFGLLLQVHGDIDTWSAPELAAALTALLGDRRLAALTVDLAAAGFVDGRGVAVLVAAALAARERGISFAVLGSRRPVLRVFDVTGVTALIAAAQR